MEANPLPLATQAYQLQLEWHNVGRYIIAGDKWWRVVDVYPGNKYLRKSASSDHIFAAAARGNFSQGEARTLSMPLGNRRTLSNWR
jgi:hypothetical protein